MTANKNSSLSDFLDESALQRYIHRRSEEYLSCAIALEKSDFTVLLETGHKISGNCESFGFGELSEVAASLYQSALKKDRKACEEALAGLKSWCVSKKSVLVLAN